MSRELFLRQLRALLSDVTEEEREEAVRYYEEYFDEAGPEQEQALLAELGSPAKVAGIIRANVPGSRQTANAGPAGNVPPASNAPDGSGRPGPNLSAAAEAAAETVAAGARSIRSRIRGLAEWDSAPHAPEPPRLEPDPQPQYADSAPREPYSYAAEGHRYAAAAPQDGRRKLLLVFLAILLFPVWIGLLGGLIGLIAGAIGAFAGMIGGGIGAVFAGFFGLIRAIPLLVSSPANGMVALASCMLGMGVGILLFGVGVFCMGTLVPMGVRFVKSVCRRLFGRGGEVS